MLDARTGTWLEIESRPDDDEVYDEVVAVGRDQAMTVFGGQSWTDEQGRLVNDMWLWTPAGER